MGVFAQGMLRRLRGPTTRAVVLALLAAGAQHSLNLCQFADHEREPAKAMAQATCSAHGASAEADQQQPHDEQSPSCCSTLAALVALPSLKGSVASAGQSEAWLPFGLRGSRMEFAVLARVESHPCGDHRHGVRFPHLRSHLALNTILV